MAQDDSMNNSEQGDLTARNASPAEVPATRRGFLARAVAAASGIPLATLLEPAAQKAEAQAVACPTPAIELPEIGKIQTTTGNKLRGTIKVKNQLRNLPRPAGQPLPQVRYFAGFDAAGNQVWPPGGDANQKPVPGPTLEANVGDTVELSFFNEVDVSQFMGSLDRGEEGRDNGCDQVNLVNAQGIVTVKNWYPAQDKAPDCLHGSSTANIHFHGTHTSPDFTGDNVLIQVRPLSTMTAADEKKIQGQFQKIFDNFDNGVRAKSWQELNSPWTADQETALKHYDATAPYQGKHGLPSGQQLWPQDQQALDQHIWPQWYIGSFPYVFSLPKYPGNNPELPPSQTVPLRMGQAPGTHWYHAHKHGSTAINLFNGMAGAFIIRSPDYDGKLNSFYQNRLKEKLLVIQQLTPVPNLMGALSGAKAPAPPIYVNGVLNKNLIITMQPGEIQFWRLVNACAGGGQGKITMTAGAPPAIQFKQIAQDGVQYCFENYNKPQNGQDTITMAPANRVDLLVQAPLAAGCYTFGTTPQGNGPLLTVQVAGNRVNPAMTFPKTAADFPVFPEYLHDIDPAKIHVHRELNYGWGGPTDANTGPGRDMKTGTAPKYMIDGKQFEDQVIDEVMLLDSAEEWTVYNSTLGIAHPFHIHINPFQVIEVFDPNNGDDPVKLSPPYIWWDTFAIPPGKNDPTTGKVKPGYFKMRSRFVDFTGTYVNHCHILAHEDRGMMQLIQVVSNRTVLKHH